MILLCQVNVDPVLLPIIPRAPAELLRNRLGAGRRKAMNDPGKLFGSCLADLDRDRKAIAGLSAQFAKVSGMIAACVKDGHPDDAIALLDRHHEAVTTLCGLARKAIEQEIALAIKMSELAQGRGAGGDSEAHLNEIGRGVDAFVLNSLDYLGRERTADPEASSC
jgi:hypothetical protein